MSALPPGRSERPSDLQTDGSATFHDTLKRCPFCRGNEADTPTELDRLPTGDEKNSPTWQVRVVPNRYPAFELPDGAHEVIIESPEHTTRFTDLDPQQSSLVLQMWARRIAYWRNESSKEYLLLFKNEGLAAGASLEHIHSQFTAMDFLPEDLQTMWTKLSQEPKGYPAKS